MSTVGLMCLIVPITQSIWCLSHSNLWHR